MKRLTTCFAVASALALTAGQAGVASASESQTAVNARTEMSRASLLLRAGKKDEALAAMRALFPQGPPDGKVALEYYRIVGSTPGGWTEARTGLEKLTKLDPNYGAYRAALATLLTTRESTQAEAFRMLSAVVQRTDIDRQQLLQSWESALLSRKPNVNEISLYQDYLGADPKNIDVRGRLASLKNAQAQRNRIANDPVQLARQRGLTLLDEGKSEAAGQVLGPLHEKLPKDPQVIGGLGLIKLREGQHAEALALFEQALRLDPDNAGKWKSLLTTAHYWKLMRESAAARDQKNFEDAQVKARAAIQLDPGNAEGLALLAGIVFDHGDTKQAQTLYRDALSKEPDNGAAIRGLTALLVNQKRRSEAIELLNRQGPSATQPDGKYTYLRVGILRDEADELVQANQVEQAQTMLESALLLAPDNPWVRLDLAALLHNRLPASAAKIINEGLKISPRDPQMLYASALYFAKADAPVEALRSLGQIAPAEFSTSMIRLRQRMNLQVALERAIAFDRDGLKTEAAAVLDQAAVIAEDDPDFVYSVANAWMALKQPSVALNLVRQVVARQAVVAVPLQMRFASLLNRAQQDAELSDLLQKLNATSGLTADERNELLRLRFSLDMRAAYASLEAGESVTAGKLADQLRAVMPNDSRVLVLFGNIALTERRFDDAMVLFKRANAAEIAANPTAIAPTEADGAMARMERRREGKVAVGFDMRGNAGTGGVSDLTVREIPVEARFPIGYHGHALVNIDTISIGAGTLDLTDMYSLRRFGKIQALAPQGLVTATPQEARGTALAVGYETDNWRVDLGTTPQGFPVQDVVGGMKWSGSSQAYSYSLDVAKRPVTGSLLSYAGVADPASGEVWGGVRSSGADMRLSYENGFVDASLSMGYHVLDGRNVLSNTQFELRPELSWAFVQDADMRLSTGLVYTYWKFKEDLSYYTFGHGGYYSPQSYHSITLPLRWSGRSGLLSYAVRGSVSASWTQTKDMPYYPIKPDLQALAGNPIHAGGDSNGTGFSLGGALEYPIAPKLVLGGRFDIGRAAYYTPNSLILYLRYQFDTPRDSVPFPPESPRSHAHY